MTNGRNVSYFHGALGCARVTPRRKSSALHLFYGRTIDCKDHFGEAGRFLHLCLPSRPRYRCRHLFPRGEVIAYDADRARYFDDYSEINDYAISTKRGASTPLFISMERPHKIIHCGYKQKSHEEYLEPNIDLIKTGDHRTPL